MRYKKAVVIINPSSGQERGMKHQVQIEAVLRKTAEEVSVRLTEKKGDAARYAKEAAEKGAELVVAVGGDGTVNEVINGLAVFEQPPKLGIIPLGTVNNLSRAVGIPTNTKAAIQTLTSAETAVLDVGKINGGFFANVVAFGNIPDSIHATGTADKTKFGPLAYAVKGFQNLDLKQRFSIRITSEEYHWSGEAALLVILLTGQLGTGPKLLPAAQIDDGLMNVVVIKELSFMEGLQLIPALIKRDFSDNENLISWQTAMIEVTGREALEPNVDGDKEEGDVFWSLSVLPQKLRVLIPEEQGSSEV